MKKDTEFLRTLNETLLLNQKEWSKKFKNLEEELDRTKREKDATIKVFQEDPICSAVLGGNMCCCALKHFGGCSYTVAVGCNVVFSIYY